MKIESKTVITLSPEDIKKALIKVYGDDRTKFDVQFQLATNPNEDSMYPSYELKEAVMTGTRVERVSRSSPSPDQMGWTDNQVRQER